MPTCDFKQCSYDECGCKDCRECKLMKFTTIKKKEKKPKKPKLPPCSIDCEEFYTEGELDEFLLHRDEDESRQSD